MPSESAPGPASAPVIFDEQLALDRKVRALRHPVDGADFLVRRVAEDLAFRLDTVERRFARAAAIGCVTADASNVLLASGKVTEIIRIEADPRISPAASLIVDGRLPLEPQSVDLIVSLLALHEINDLPGFLAQARRALKPDGLLLAAFAGAGTLGELRESLISAETELTGGASARVAPFVDIRDAGALLQRAGFALPVADIETVTVRYNTVFDLMADLRAMGATSSLADRSRRLATRRLFHRAAEIYAERFADPDGRIRATFVFNWVSGWSPDASQQKPLAPGSATVSLKDILKG